MSPANAVILVADTDEQVDEAVTRLARVGHDSVRGYLRGGMRAWAEAGYESSEVEQISVAELRRMIEERPELQVLDVRRHAEFNAGHAPRASNVPLSPRRREEAARLDADLPLAVICAGGYRSSAATSLLRPLGFQRLYNVEGGTSAWLAAGLPVEKPAAAI